MVHAGWCRPGRAGRAFRFEFQDLVLLRTAHGLAPGARAAATRVKRALARVAAPAAGRPAAVRRAHLAAGGRVVVRDGDSVWQPESGQLLLDFAVDELARRAESPRAISPRGKARGRDARPSRANRPPSGSSAASRSRTTTSRRRAPPTNAPLEIDPELRRRVRQPRPPRPRGRRPRHRRALLPPGADARRDRSGHPLQPRAGAAKISSGPARPPPTTAAPSPSTPASPTPTTT